MRARILLALSALSVFGVACADLFGFKELKEGEASVPDVNVPDVNVPDVDTCPHARWPDPPTTDGSTGTPTQLHARDPACVLHDDARRWRRVVRLRPRQPLHHERPGDRVSARPLR